MTPHGGKRSAGRPESFANNAGEVKDHAGRRIPPFLLAGLLTAAVVPAAVPASPPVVEYTIQASLDEKEKTISGDEILVWRNPSSDEIRELQFHLYLNAFKNDRSLFARESGGRLRGDKAGTRPEDWGWIDVVSVRTEKNYDLKPLTRFLEPDGYPWPADPAKAKAKPRPVPTRGPVAALFSTEAPAPKTEDETVLAVPLLYAIPPHGQVKLSIAFRAKLPRIFARTGYVRDYILAGQWFPKIGVYEPAGMRGRSRGGWNCHSFHANSEFYADYGRYDVTLTLPAGVGSLRDPKVWLKPGDEITIEIEGVGSISNPVTG